MRILIVVRFTEYSPDAPGINPGMNWGRPAFRGPPRPMHPHPSNLGFGQGQRELINVPVESHSHSFHMQNPNATAEVIKVTNFLFGKKNCLPNLPFELFFGVVFGFFFKFFKESGNCFLENLLTKFYAPRYVF